MNSFLARPQVHLHPILQAKKCPMRFGAKSLPLRKAREAVSLEHQQLASLTEAIAGKLNPENQIATQRRWRVVPATGEINDFRLNAWGPTSPTSDTDTIAKFGAPANKNYRGLATVESKLRLTGRGMPKMIRQRVSTIKSRKEKRSMNKQIPFEKFKETTAFKGELNERILAGVRAQWNEIEDMTEAEIQANAGARRARIEKDLKLEFENGQYRNWKEV